MLVLSRKVGERILIGEDTAITIVRIGPNTVRVGIDAPREVKIAREELCLPRAVGDDVRLPVRESSAGQSCREHEAAVAR